MKKRILSCLLAICLLVGLLPTAAWAADIVASGTCGENLTWELDSEGTLTIEGEGAMEDYSSWSGAPWSSYSDSVFLVKIGDGVTSIGKYAFPAYSSLTSVTIPDSVTNIGYSAFSNCTSLTSVIIPDSVTSIGEYAFYYCTSLTSVIIPDSVTSIGDCAFSDCSSLTGIWVDENNPNYSSDACGVLHDKSKTKLIQAPGGIADTYAISDSVTSIGKYAFSDCSGLTSVTIPDSVTSIGDSAFSCCTSLTSITIPDSVTSIGEDAFYYCTSLTSDIIPDSVTSIGDYAFCFCTSLTSVTIPDSVTSIGDCAFSDCSSLKQICFCGNAPSIAPEAFYRVTATAYYPEGNATWTSEVMRDYGGTITWAPYTPNPFTDVPTEKYYYEPVMWAYTNGITAGATATTFDPNGTCTRAQVVTFLWRAAGKPEPTTTNNPFTDVDSDDYFYKAVLWAVEKGITAGATATTFNPKGACNRAQVVTFMYRAAGSPAVSSQNNPFEDVPADKYYHDAVLWAVEKGITAGISATKFAPGNTCTRAQIVTFLYRGYAK